MMLSDNEVLLVSDALYSGNILAECQRKYAVITLPTILKPIFFKRHPEIRVDLNMANIVVIQRVKAIQSVLMTLNAGIE
jgi:ABC-2 type transport system permease protein